MFVWLLGLVVGVGLADRIYHKSDIKSMEVYGMFPLAIQTYVGKERFMTDFTGSAFTDRFKWKNGLCISKTLAKFKTNKIEYNGVDIIGILILI